MGYTRPQDSARVTGRLRQVRFVLCVVLFLNVGVALAKLLWGVMTNSAAMQADGFHSLFDGMSNVVGLVGISIAARQADRDHPYGHSKYETYASAVIAAMLVVAAYRVSSSALAHLSGAAEPPRVETGSFAVMLSTLAVNLAVTTWERGAGTRLGSEILLADAGHTRADVLVSVGVIVSLVLVHAGYERADPVVALLVAGAIVYTAWGVIRQAGATLSDMARISPSEISQVAHGVAGVLGCHHVRTRGSEGSVYVDLHVQVDETRCVADGHRIAEEVERAIGERFPQVIDVIAHLEPFDEYQARETAREDGGA